MSERIISLTSENIKRLRAVHITPNGQSVEIAGRNGAGKSSVLDSIWYALAGRSVLPDRPIRDGESRAETVVELTNYTVSRTFTAAGGGTLKVIPKSTPGDGKPIASPQAFLDGLLSTLTFDPFEFTRLKDAEQGETLRKLLGLDFSSDDAKRKQLYDKRTDVNRTIESLSIKLKDAPEFPDVTGPSVLLADILTSRNEAARYNQDNRTLKQSLENQQAQLRKFTADQAECVAEIALLEHRLTEYRRRHEVARKAHEELAPAVAALLDQVAQLQDKDLATFDQKILAAEEFNRKLNLNNARHGLLRQKAEATGQLALLTVDMDSIDRGKEKALSDAKFPLPGLSFSASGGVAYNGIPFSQISTAEQIRVSTAIGLSLNPGLKVIFIRNGSLIDDAGIRTLCELAQAAGAQIWIERVGALSGELPGVVIEDGAVSETTSAMLAGGVLTRDFQNV